LTSKRLAAGAGLSLGAVLAGPAAVQAEDIEVTNLNGSGPGSLRQAVADANADADADRILFASKLSGTINLGGDDIELEGGDVEIVGPGARQVTIDAEGASRAFFARGGYVTFPGIDVAISGLTITGGEAGRGGGFYAYGADVDVTISHATISANSASADGGGLLFSVGNDNQVAVEYSTVSGNSANGKAGGIYVEGADFRLVNSTVSGNTAGDDGGGVYLLGPYPSATADIGSSTVASNTADDDGGGVHELRIDAVLRGSLVADNTAGSEGDDLFDSGPGGFDAGFSLVEDPDVSDPFGLDGVITGRDPNLKPLKNNGGPTNTHAFKKSPAKNKLPKAETPKQDQRGAKRKRRGDIGAYELVKCEGVIVNRVGTAKKDKLRGTKKKDGILGLGGNDKLAGKKGKDGLCGGRGKDKLKGGPGKDKLDGGPGKDKEVQ
jgi:parallel beta-helix repeat protein